MDKKCLNIFLKNFPTVYLFIRLVYSTYELKFTGLDNLKKAEAASPKTGVIFVLWHEHLISGIIGLRNFQPIAIVSSSKDGDLIAHTMERMGFGIARGSSTRGGAQALLKAVKGLKNKRPIVLTVDGQRLRIFQNLVLFLYPKNTSPHNSPYSYYKRTIHF